MPTGYTAGVRDGTITTLRQFALTCARAFGALISMRDAPSDAPIPEEFPPETSYYDTGIASARAALESLPRLLASDCEREAAREFKRARAAWEESMARRAAVRARYEAMLALVEAWTVPTPEHVELRRFMMDQLRESIRFDCEYQSDPPRQVTGAEWRRQRVAQAKRDLSYHTKERAEEIDRAAQRTAWVKALRALDDA